MSALAATIGVWLADRLVLGSLQAIVLVALAWVACRRRGRLSAAMQAALWWAVTLKIVLVFAPLPAIRIPILPATPPSTGLALSTSSERVSPTMATAPVATADGTRVPWLLLVVGVWCVGTAWHAARLLVALSATRAMVERATRSDDDAETVGQLAAALGLSAVPEVRLSAEAVAPLVVGFRRPVVLMPMAATLTPDERLMALGHEFTHIRRRDLAWGWIPALAERLFFFHPLVRLAAREYATAREAACDAALVRALDLAPQDYGRLLVRFGVAGERIAWAAGGDSTSAASLRRRLDMLQHLSRSSRGGAWLTAAFMVMALVPSQLVARTAPAAPASILQSGSDVELPRLAPPRPAVAPQNAPADSRPEAAPAPVPQPESTTTVDFLNQRLAETDRLLQDLNATRAGGQALDDQKLLDSATQADLAIERARLAEAMARAEHAHAAQADQAVLAEGARQYAISEAERQLELAKRMQASQQRELERLLADQPELRQRLLRQQFEDLKVQLGVLAEMQKRLEKEAEQLKLQLNQK